MDMEANTKILKSAFDSPTFGEDASFRLDKPVGSASISPCGRDIVLASRVGLHIIDLDSPYSPPRYLPHHTPWEIADVQWSPFASRDYWVVSTSNQKALVWNLETKDPRSSIEHILHAHTRAITDINFSAHHPDVLATCAVDSFVHCWDIRHPARPAISFCDWFAGATQVKWNRQEPHIIASSHHKTLRIWDDRKGAYPLRSIEAHATKIYGVDWNRTEPRSLVTCSLDRTIKFWDYGSSADKPERTIDTPFPVWRARHTPFGFGLLAMPQRGDFNLHLYNRRLLDDNEKSRKIMPMWSFEGHDDRVKEFLWRPRGTITDGIDNREFQLVSWGSDKLLRLHRVSEDTMHKIGHQRGQQAKANTSLTRKDAPYKTFRESLEGFSTDHVAISDISLVSHSNYNSGLRKDLGLGTSKGLRIERGHHGTGLARSIAVTKNRNSVDIDPISWMKGVKIGKREISPSGARRSLPSMFSPDLMTSDRTWETFESLGEEITHIGQKFGKVAFDEIDMLNRVVTIGLMGPWGSMGTSSWIRCRIQFPEGYPENTEPLFAIKDSPSTSNEQVKRICSEVSLILQAHLAQRLSSLEAIVLYLLGERDLNRSLLRLARRPDGELDVPNNSAESSSDEDEELQSSQTVLHESVAASNAQYNVPLPKACGALWADDGRLVCFFPRRQENSNPLVSKLALKASSQKAIFEGFERVDQDLLFSKRHLVFDRTEDEDSDFEYLSSSSDSSTSSVNLSGQLFMPSLAWHVGACEAPHYRSVDGSYRFSGAVDDKSLPPNTNYVSMHTCHDLLPSNISFAREYILSPNPQDSCTHNSLVAAESGAHDIADVWALVELIIRREVPLDIVRYPPTSKTVLVAARRAAYPLRRKDSAIDMSYDLTEDSLEDKTVKWGEHPFGSRWLVDSLFEYFEALADVQMLAMLSCVLSEPFSNFSASSFQLENQSQSSSETNDATFDKYYPSTEIAHEHLRLRSPDLQSEGRRREVAARNPAVASPHKEVSASIPHSVPRNISDGQSRTTLERQDSQGTSLSTSPEQLRRMPRSNSNLASAFTASLSRPFSFNASAPSSPPTQSKKRVSPAGSYLGAPTGAGWGPTSIFGRSSTITEDPRPIPSFSGSDAEEEPAFPQTPVFKTKLKNQQQFPHDGYANVPLLNPEDDWRYRAYRDAYAHMLFVWGMPIAMCEVLKYNGEPLQATASSLKERSGIGINRMTSSPAKMEQGLCLKDTCSACDAAPVSSPNGQVCRACSSPRVPLICLFCNSIIRGLASPCLSCGHVLHSSCRSLLSEQASNAPYTEEDEEGEEVCISGCGCRCSDHVIIEVNEAQYQLGKSSQGADTMVAGENAAVGWQGSKEGEEDHAWQDVVYESLARNLEQSRTLTPRSSQIWRGGDSDVSRNRKKSVGSNLRMKSPWAE